MPKHVREPDNNSDSLNDSSKTLIKKRRKRHESGQKDIESLTDSLPAIVHAEEEHNSRWFSYKRLQNIIFGIQITFLVFHLSLCTMCVTILPKAAFMLYFHGVVSPVCIILYFVGFLSILFAVLSIYRRESIHVSIQRQAQWYRRYMRATKFVLLLWFLSSCTSVFGCWMYNYAIHLESTMPAKEIYASRNYIIVIKEILVGVSHLQSDLEIFHGISSDMQPLKTIKLLGEYYHLSGLVLVLIPIILLFVCVQIQRKYYAFRFSID